MTRIVQPTFLISKNNKTRRMRPPCCLCICESHLQLLNAWTNLYENWYVYHGSWAQLKAVLHKSLPSVYVYPLIVARQQLGKNVTNTQATLEEFLDASFSMGFVSYQRRVCVSVYLLIVTRQRLNLFLWPWRWRRYVPPKRRLKLDGLHGVISQKMILFVTIALNTSNPTRSW
jgi:hypothetical protein